MARRGDRPQSALSDAKLEDPAGSEGIGAPPGEAAAKPEEQVAYSISPGFSGFLGAQRIGLAISSYQSGKFYLLGQNVDGGLMVHERFFSKAMGLCVPGKDTILLATLYQIIKFRNALEPGQQINDVYDACYVPRGRAAGWPRRDRHAWGAPAAAILLWTSPEDGFGTVAFGSQAEIQPNSRDVRCTPNSNIGWQNVRYTLLSRHRMGKPETSANSGHIQFARGLRQLHPRRVYIRAQKHEHFSYSLFYQP